MVLAERAQALALTKFATMVRQDESGKTEDKPAKKARSDDVTEGPETRGKAAHITRTADLLPPVIWGGN